MDEITLNKTEYDRIVREREDAVAKVERLETEKAEAIKEAEQAEGEKVKAEEKLKETEDKLKAAEEQARQDALRDERLDKLGAGFMAKLGDKTKDRLKSQAASMQDDEWAERIEELEDAYGVKADEADDDSADDQDTAVFSREEVASSAISRAKPQKGEPSPNERRSVIHALTKK